MHIKVDEDLPKAVTSMLQNRGHEAISVLEQGMSGCKDSELWQAVLAEQRFLITADKGFADIRLYAPGKHAGVLLLRPAQDGIRPMIDLLERVLASYELETLAKTVTVATPRGIRIRRSAK